jgi:uroporphyrinogen-III synthase
MRGWPLFHFLSSTKEHSGGILTVTLGGKVVAYVEARMQSEMGALVERHGGVPLAAPVLQEVYNTDTPEVTALIDDLCGGRVDIAVLQTGVGTRALFEAADTQGRLPELLAALEGMTVIARSPKPAAVLRRNRVRIDLMPPEPFTSEDLIVSIDGIDLSGREVAVQAYGGPNNLLTRTLRERGASVREVALYGWGLPDDLAPVRDLIRRLDAGEVDAVAFTSQPQVSNLLAIAAMSGQEAKLRRSLNSGEVLVASVGPVCTRRLQQNGLKVDVEPDHPHMGNLVLALAERFQGQAAPEAGISRG